MTEKRLSHVADVRVSTVNKHTIDGERAVRLCNYVDVYKNDDVVDGLNFMVASASQEEIDRFGIRPGDTLFTKDSETADDIGVPAFVRATEPLICGYHVAIARPDKASVCPRYLYWCLASDAAAQQWSVLATGVTRVGLRRSDIGRLSLTVPDIPAQQHVTDFLDHETAKIDALIAKQTTLRALVEERLIATSKSLTIGSVYGLGEIQLGQVLDRIQRPFEASQPVVTAYRNGQVTSRQVRREDGYTISETEHGYQGVEQGDLVFHALDGFAGAIGVAEVSGKCSPVYHVCRPRPGHDVAYVAEHMRMLGLAGMLTAYAWSVRQRSVDYRNWSLLASLPVCMPTVDDQRSAACQIAETRAVAERTIVAIDTLVAAMRERRSALITSAVTGQIDVSTYGRAKAPESVDS